MKNSKSSESTLENCENQWNVIETFVQGIFNNYVGSNFHTVEKSVKIIDFKNKLTSFHLRLKNIIIKVLYEKLL